MEKKKKKAKELFLHDLTYKNNSCVGIYYCILVGLVMFYDIFDLNETS